MQTIKKRANNLDMNEKARTHTHTVRGGISFSVWTTSLYILIRAFASTIFIEFLHIHTQVHIFGGTER